MPHELPSDEELSSFTAYYDRATLNKNGTCTVIFTLPREMKGEVLRLSDNDGMAVNVTVWATEGVGEDWLEKLAGDDGVEVGAGG